MTLFAAVVVAAGFWLRRDSVRAVEPVAFAPVFVEQFSAGGTLSDAWADFDGDGDPDRFVGFNGEASRLYRNDGTGGFTDVAGDLGLVVTRPVRTSAWGDFDADGDADLFLGYAGEGTVTALWRNDAGRSFTEVSMEAGLDLPAGVTRQASWVDYDGDGDLDLYLAMRDGPNRLFRNTGGQGTAEDAVPIFEDVTQASGIGDPRRSVGAVWFDAEQDGDLDVLVANMNGDANGLWLNDDGSFTDAAPGTDIAGGGRGVGDEATGTVRPCVVDVDGDGWLDLHFANYGPNEVLLGGQNREWPSRGSDMGLDQDTMDDTCVWGDFDHDGTLDVFVNGTITGGVQYRDHLMRREQGSTFVDATPAEWATVNADHGATWVDYDQDGDLDLALTGAPEDGQHLLMQNLLRPEFARHSLSIRVLDSEGRSLRAGAEVRLYVAGTDRLIGTRHVDSGSGYDSQSDLPVHFGLPGAQPVDVEVIVPAGGLRHVTRLESVDPAAHRGRSLNVRTVIDG